MCIPIIHHCQEQGKGSPKWNSVIITVYTYSSAFPVTTCQNVCSEQVFLSVFPNFSILLMTSSHSFLPKIHFPSIFLTANPTRGAGTYPRREAGCALEQATTHTHWTHKTNIKCIKCVWIAGGSGDSTKAHRKHASVILKRP